MKHLLASALIFASISCFADIPTTCPTADSIAQSASFTQASGFFHIYSVKGSGKLDDNRNWTLTTDHIKAKSDSDAITLANSALKAGISDPRGPACDEWNGCYCFYTFTVKDGNTSPLSNQVHSLKVATGDV